jgi:hypothetical protein
LFLRAPQQSRLCAFAVTGTTPLIDSYSFLFSGQPADVLLHIGPRCFWRDTLLSLPLRPLIVNPPSVLLLHHRSFLGSAPSLRICCSSLIPHLGSDPRLYFFSVDLRLDLNATRLPTVPPCWRTRGQRFNREANAPVKTKRDRRKRNAPVERKTGPSRQKTDGSEKKRSNRKKTRPSENRRSNHKENRPIQHRTFQPRGETAIPKEALHSIKVLRGLTQGWHSPWRYAIPRNISEEVRISSVCPYA